MHKGGIMTEETELFTKWFKENTPQDGTVNERTSFSYQFVRDAFVHAFNSGREDNANSILDSWCRNKDDYCPQLKSEMKNSLKQKKSLRILQFILCQ